MKPITSDDLAHRFAFHATTTLEKQDAHAAVRRACHRLAGFITDACPPGRETSLAVTHVENAMMWANAALARHG